MNLFYQPAIPNGIDYLDEDESRHCVKVLRHKAGDSLTITDGRGFFYKATIAVADIKKCIFTITEKLPEASKKYSVHIAISPTKNADRIEWFVEKAVEFGIDQVTLLDCENTERSFLKVDRLKKVAMSAMKQSLKATLPVINDIVPFTEFVNRVKEELKCIAYVDQSNPHHLKDVVKRNTPVCVCIGPEGDFTTKELMLAQSMNFQKVSLGTSRLRTETAGLAACHIINLINQ